MKSTILFLLLLSVNLFAFDSSHEFKLFIQLAKGSFIHQDLMHESIDDIYNKHKDEMRGLDESAFAEKLDFIMAKFKDGHSVIAENPYRDKATYKLPVRIQKIDNLFYISLDEKSWFLLLKYNDVPIMDYFKSLSHEYAAPTKGYNTLFTLSKSIYSFHPYNNAKPDLLKPVVLTIRSLEGKTTFNKEVFWSKVDREALKTTKDTLTTDCENAFVKQNNLPCIEFLPNKIAHVLLPAFQYSDDLNSLYKKQIRDIFKKASTSSGIIIDVRQNGGGDWWYEEEVLKYISNSNVQNLKYQTYYFPNTVAVDDHKYHLSLKGSESDIKIHYGMGGMFDPFKQDLTGQRPEKGIQVQLDDVIPYKKFNVSNKPIRVLTSAMTFSAGECFAYLAKYHLKLQTIGETTGGGSAASINYTLPDSKLVIRFSAVKLIEYDYQAKGIPPDIEVKKTIDDLINNKDRVLETAIKTF